MIWETFGFAALGLLISAAAPRLLPDRFGDRPRLLLLTAVPSAVLGGLLTETVFGPEHGAYPLAASAVVALLLVAVASRPHPQGTEERAAEAALATNRPPVGAAGTAASATEVRANAGTGSSRDAAAGKPLTRSG